MAEREAVGPLRCADADAAAATLLRAFFEDPFLVWLFPDAARRPRAGLWFLRTCVEYGLRYGAASSNEDASGVALWLTPGNTTTTLTRLARAGFLQMPFRVGLTAFSRFAAAGSVLEPAHKAHVPGPHWYLFWLGVEPSRRCAGIGAALIQEGIDRADQAGLPCYLDTQAQANVAYYERRGFRVVAEMQLPRGGPRSWSMLRGPAR